MDSKKKNLLILAALLGVWGLTFAFRSPWGTAARRDLRETAERPVRRPAAQGGGIPRLKTDLLDRPRPPYPPEVQNIFGTPPPPPPPPVSASVAPQPPAPPPPDPFQEEARRLRYVGFLKDEDSFWAFIVQGPEVHILKEGAVLAGHIRIQAVTEDALLLSSVDGEKQVRLPLSPEAGSGPRPPEGAAPQGIRRPGIPQPPGQGAPSVPGQ